ncbi:MULTISPECIES: multicopper oxidase domain-containing protein [Methylobacter]|jgi:Multicopper oxidase.|uniref:multicopper oxidase domain-containing protein n=1 Tax=Methylobacter TaxID=429 RepID=UPI00047F0D07|nr:MULTISPECIES: multicopper oxidase domain-containing protein [Methylobacter]MDI1279401.1 multicopper oxidase domain-containing protein [Methylobacter sp.]MDI1360168.1 multicopper oxidase domain-containing protein [Methylobacter sp.]
MRKNLLTFIGGATLLLMHPWSQAASDLPPTAKVEMGPVEEVCSDFTSPEWRKEQVIDGVQIQASRLCNPDNPSDIAAFVKGTNGISMKTLMETQLAADAVTMSDDVDGDGDPDKIIIKLEVAELNGHSPDMKDPTTTFDIAPGIQPTFWVFAPKTRDMSTLSIYEPIANPLLRVPSPVIRVEQDDVVWLVLENTHYLPHSIHLHGIDHPFMDHVGVGNDGVAQTSNMDTMPGKSKTYVIKPRQPGTMYYHCHVQPHTHIPMGLQGIFVVEENRPNNWPQTLNVGAGQVRHPSVAVLEKYAREYDLHYQSADKELHELVARSANDPRLIAKHMNMEYDTTDATDDYFMLNGRSFPYTLRESLIEMKQDEKVKLRVLNGHTESLALHIHGHKPTVTHYDGVDNGPSSYIQRDVHAMVPAQRLDLELSGVDDGLHSFGQGIWMFHDHVEKAFTTNGVGEGGDISLVVYDGFLDEKGIPKSHGMSLAPYFTKGLWKRNYPIWQDYDEWRSLGLPDLKAEYQPSKVAVQTVQQQWAPEKPAAEQESSAFGKLLFGLILGLLSYVLIINRQTIYERVRKLLNK